jgi:hypothetical protein
MNKPELPLSKAGDATDRPKEAMQQHSAPPSSSEQYVPPPPMRDANHQLSEDNDDTDLNLALVQLRNHLYTMSDAQKAGYMASVSQAWSSKDAAAEVRRNK